MAKFTTNLTVTTPNETVSATKVGNYDVAIKVNAELEALKSRSLKFGSIIKSPLASSIDMKAAEPSASGVAFVQPFSSIFNSAPTIPEFLIIKVLQSLNVSDPIEAELLNIEIKPELLFNFWLNENTSV